MNLSLREIGRAALGLGLFDAVASALLAGTHALTRERIQLSTQERLLKNLNTLVPARRYNNTLASDTRRLQVPELGGPVTVYRARRDGKPVAAIFTVRAPDGYSGAIDLLVGVNADGTLAGVRVTAHRETPGLGDKIDLNVSDWILGFDGRSLGDPPPARWAVKKDGGEFDQFAGATITPRAVVAAVRRCLEFMAAQPAAVFALETPA
jgi:Na+-translocating ferredoxin:NAD+ oxidoreductase subunit G